MAQPKRRKWPWITGALVSLGIALAFVFGTYEFTMSESEIQDKITEVLPVEHSGVTMSNVTVDLSETDDSITIEASGEASRLGRTYAFTVQTQGVPEYEFTSGNFYFRASSVEILSLAQTEGETVGQTVSRVGGLVRELFPQREEVVDELEYAATQLAPEVQAWLEGRASGAVTYVLQRAPIYTLPSDAKGFAAQAVLDEVRIENNNLVVKLSLYRLGSWVLLFSFVAVLSIALMFSPVGWVLVAFGGVLGS